MYSLMYSVCILYLGQVHVFADVHYSILRAVHVLLLADVFCTQGRSMYLLMYSLLRAGPCIS
jgi:hypothetical protein